MSWPTRSSKPSSKNAEAARSGGCDGLPARPGRTLGGGRTPDRPQADPPLPDDDLLQEKGQKAPGLEPGDEWLPNCRCAHPNREWLSGPACTLPTESYLGVPSSIARL